MTDATNTDLAATDLGERGEVTIVREFDAPRELVFNAMIDPQQLTKFWGPVGMSTPVDRITIDARPGGVFETVMVSDEDGSEYPTRATYLRVVAPELLSWEEDGLGMVATSTFTDLGDGRTRVEIHQTNVPEMYRTPEALSGFNSSLDRFAAYLAELQA